MNNKLINNYNKTDITTKRKTIAIYIVIIFSFIFMFLLFAIIGGVTNNQVLIYVSIAFAALSAIPIVILSMQKEKIDSTEHFLKFKDIIETYVKNIKLCKLCENYIDKEDNLELDEIELEVLNFTYSNNSDALSKYKQKINNELKFEEQFIDFIINSLIICFENSSDYQNLKNSNSSTDFEEIEKLYNFAIRKGLIPKTDVDDYYNAFLFLIYFYKKIKVMDYYLKRLKIYSVNLNSTDEELIEQLWEKCYDAEEIKHILIAKECQLNNYECLYTDIYDKYDELIEGKIEELENDDDFNDLLED